MSFKKTLASIVIGTVVSGAALVAMAAPASANDEGSEIGGGIYWFNTVGPLSSQSAATQIWSGTGTARPWATLTTERNCPAGTQAIQAYVRIPQAGVPENDWDQVALSAASTSQDADGRFYTTALPSRPSVAQVLTYNAANGGQGVFPFVVTCRDSLGNPLGNFRTEITIVGTTTTLTSFSIPRSDLPLASSTTTLATSAATVEAGTSVDLTATVTPAAATGDVQFFAGAVSLGTATITAGTATLSTSAIPVGTNSITAQYLGGSNAASTSAAVSVEVTAVAPRSTTTTLAVSPNSGPAYAAVTLTSTVVASAGAANGTVTFKDGVTVLGSVPVTAGVVPTFTTNVLNAGTHSLVAEFVGTGPYTNSASPAVAATYTLVGAVDEQTVTVEIPQGLITITTPYTPAAPLALGMATLDPSDSTYSASAAFNDIVITDTRAGDLGFTASVVSGAFVGATDSFPGIHAGLTGLTKVQVPGNALLTSDYAVTNHVPFVDGLDVPKVFAQLPAGVRIGTAAMNGVFGVDQVPTSVAPGLYTATVTFTAV